MAFPGTSSFIGEILLFMGIFATNEIAGYMAAAGIFLCSTYSIWLYNRIMCGNLNTGTTVFTDVDAHELFILRVFVFLMIALGLRPDFILTSLYLDTLGI
jgi:NADH-quinone oxidoreductase subunit M